ncbi:MAG: chemotaxis protein CheD [Planctomycetota bacterium]
MLGAMNNNIVMLGVGDFGVSRTPGGMVRTLALGSCVAILIHDRATGCIGMDHVALPDSNIAPERAKQRPGHFADTGVPALLRAMQCAAGSVSKKVSVKLVGGANVADPNNTFNIGKRNALAVRKALWRYGLGPIAEDLGGNYSRSVSLLVDDGRVLVTSPGRPAWEV